MTVPAEIDDYRALFLRPTPLVDLRAPVEFARGAFPSALNLPLLSDEERARVGICYREHGQRAAIELGHQLVAGSVREQRLQQWLEFAGQFPDACLYCWRGGLRSQTVQQWLADAGATLARVRGGYKALRSFLLTELERSVAAADFILVSGKTGTGKTRVIEHLVRGLDLEGLANHRGSAFGAMLSPQPSQIDFENALSIALLRLLAAGRAPVVLEDEGRVVGRVHLPGSLRDAMARAPLVEVVQGLEERVDVVLQDYVADLGRRYQRRSPEDGHLQHSERLQADLERIGRRLGGERLQRVRALLRDAFEQQWRSGDIGAHREWIRFLLQHYYDPMYEYQLSRRAGKRLFSGDRQAVLAWLQQRLVDADES